MRKRARGAALALGLSVLLAYPVAATDALPTQQGRTYVVALNGSDAADGLSPAQAFRHIQRCADVMRAGDRCLVRAGTYRETVVVRTPGVTLRPYGHDWVTVSGLDVISGPWRRLGRPEAGLFAAPATSRLGGSPLDNQVVVDGAMVPLARWPRPGPDLLRPTEAMAGPGTTRTIICDAALTPRAGGHFWRGALVHVLSGLGWWANTMRVSDSGVGGAPCGAGVGWIRFPRVPLALGSSAADYVDFDVIPGNPYDLVAATPHQALALLRAPGSASSSCWFWDGASLLLRLAVGASPAGHLVEMKQRAGAFVLGADHVTLTGLNSTSFAVVGADVVVRGSADTVDGITGHDMTHFVDFGRQAGTDIHAAEGGVVLAGTGDRLTNSLISTVAGNAVAVWGDRAYIYDNLIQQVDYSGSGGAGIVGEFAAPGSGAATRATIDHNTLDDLGAAGIVLFALGNTVTANDIARTGVIVNDVNGGLLSDGNFVGAAPGGQATFAYNWVHDNQATLARARHFCPQPPTMCATTGAGIYLDLSAAPWLIHHNVVWNEPFADVALNGNGTVRGSQHNLLYNNTLAGSATASVALAYQDADMSGTAIRNNIFMAPPLLAPSYAVAPVLTPNLRGDGGAVQSRPLFAAPARHDYHLAAGSPAIGTGIVIAGISPRPDQGAYAWRGPDAAWGPPGCRFTGCLVLTPPR